MESKAHPAISSLSLAFDIGLLGRTAAFLDAPGLCNLEACARFVQGAFHATSSNPEAAPFFRSVFSGVDFNRNLRFCNFCSWHCKNRVMSCSHRH